MNILASYPLQANQTIAACHKINRYSLIVTNDIVFAGLILFQVFKSSGPIREMQIHNLHVAIGAIIPEFDRESPKHMHTQPSTCRIAFREIGKV